MDKQHKSNLPKTVQSYWLDSTDVPSFPKLKENIEVDIAIIGGGISGITIASQLAKANQLDIALIESTKLLNGTTGHTTAKITAQHGLIYDQLIRNGGIEKAKLYYEANKEAAEWIESYIQANDIHCDYRKEKAYVFTSSNKNVSQLEKEIKAYEKIGIDGQFVDQIPLDIKIAGAVIMNNQAQFHPLQYLNHLVNDLVNQGVSIFEQSTALRMDNGDPATIYMKNDVQVKAKYVVSASHFPFHDGKGFFSRLFPQRSYAIAVQPEKPFPGGMYINVGKPKRSFRAVHINGKEMVLVIGDGHKTGQGNREIEHYEALQQTAIDLFSTNHIPYRWSAQDFDTPDQIPYIGKISKDHPNVFVATGFKKWGMTHGTLAGLIISDLIQGKENRFEELYSPSRSMLNTGINKVVKENVNVATQLIQGKLKRPLKEIKDLQKGEGSTVTVNGQKAGAYKSESGKLFIVDTTCTHMGCEVNWNSGDKTWDCPCHGSRFSYLGEIIEGPAEKPLKQIEFDEAE